HYFFFQAEDGIRDSSVTGVQTVLFRSLVVRIQPIVTSAAQRIRFTHATCALRHRPTTLSGVASSSGEHTRGAPCDGADSDDDSRSEERRVGKAWWWWCWVGTGGRGCEG